MCRRWKPGSRIPQGRHYRNFGYPTQNIPSGEEFFCYHRFILPQRPVPGVQEPDLATAADRQRIIDIPANTFFTTNAPGGDNSARQHGEPVCPYTAGGSLQPNIL